MQRFRLVTFDITNTLLHFRSSVGEVYSQAGKMFGVDANVLELNVSFKKHFKVLREEQPNFGATCGLSSQRWWTQLVERTFKDTAMAQASEHQLRLIADYLFKAYATKTFWVVTPGSHTLLEKLHKSSIFLGVISNSDERLEVVLEETDLRKYFDFVLASRMVQCEKPSKEIFNIALKKVGVSAKDSVHIGDEVELDYLAAKNAGWNAFLLSEKHKDFSVCDEHIVRSISELQEKIFM